MTLCSAVMLLVWQFMMQQRAVVVGVEWSVNFAFARLEGSHKNGILGFFALLQVVCRGT